MSAWPLWPGGDGPQVGQLVAVLRWVPALASPRAALVVPYVGPAVLVSPMGYVRVGPPPGVFDADAWAASTRPPTPEELTAYQLGQLQAGGL